MNRNNEYNKTKIASVSTGKAVVDIYADCFAIEKVKLVISEYEGNKASIDTYIKFADFLRITEQVRNKDIFTKIKSLAGKELISIAAEHRLRVQNGRMAKRSQRSSP